MNLLTELFSRLLKRANLFMMLTKFVLKATLSKEDYYELTLSKTEKKLVNIFQQKENGVIHPEVSAQDSWIYITLMR